MKAIAFNGSPRKTWNTATLLSDAMEGLASKGVETELVHLYDLNYKGCMSCFECKRIGGKSYGKCALNDDLTPFLAKIAEADILILGSPVYFGWWSGEMKSFIERLLYPFTIYDENHHFLDQWSSPLKRKISTGFIYTMNRTEEKMKMMPAFQYSGIVEMIFKSVFGGDSQTLFINDTFQFDDYSKYVSTAYNVQEKEKRYKEEFPEDRKRAFELGASLVCAE